MKSKKLLPMRELLQDPIYRAWFRRAPAPGSVWAPSGKPWRVYIQKVKKGPWFRKDFETYAAAANFIIHNLKEYHNFALHSKVRQFMPPMVKKGKMVYPWYPSIETHQWCSFCRRPTIYNFFQVHHAMPNTPIDPSQDRCVICGARWTLTLEFMRRRSVVR